jgi:hypothetical protein
LKEAVKGTHAERNLKRQLAIRRNQLVTNDLPTHLISALSELHRKFETDTELLHEAVAIVFSSIFRKFGIPCTTRKHLFWYADRYAGDPCNTLILNSEFYPALLKHKSFYITYSLMYILPQERKADMRASTVVDWTKKYPRIPPAVQVQEAANLRAMLGNDRELLNTRKFRWQQVKNLELYLQKLARAEACWVNCKEEAKTETANLKRFAGNGYKLRSSLCSVLRDYTKKIGKKYAYWSRSRNRTYADLVQDLFELGKCIRDNSEWLRKEGFDMTLGTHALDYSARLTRMVAVKANNLPANSKELVHRNKMAKILTDLIDTIRTDARVRLYQWPERAARYRNDYYRELRKKQ